MSYQTYRRKKDGAKFRADITQTRQKFSRESIELRPLPGQWPLVLRSHWKGVTAFKAQYLHLDGSAIE